MLLRNRRQTRRWLRKVAAEQIWTIALPDGGRGMSKVNSFLDPARQEESYAPRLAGRSSALMQAKTPGRPVPETVAGLLKAHHEHPDWLGLVLDVGCGRGTSTPVLRGCLRARRIIGLDASASLLAQARERVQGPAHTRIDFIEGDFHDLPLSTGACDTTVAAFCLYHSPRKKARPP
ncbi:class I SAM-dependent methyltransferase [Streptomyces spinosisporus]|jgi:SAM-dependent methyltransferase|uniref:Methyltransferase domain-containing protein n=1 Tax=Streptomyces spinosisporus TaxID=2927582 RepID=A0ABS9XWB3_9ACTN|nr:class I SAM-dependent methyltransferase [Streptomyces spinosisporus]MCI3246373.1 methyltransferase domain-containing protein [Streptomyces spinosisporus]